MTDLAGEITRLTGLGLQVFPARSGGKSPAVKGWQELATANPNQAAELVTRFPHCNLAVATGAKSGVFVLDVDTNRDDGWDTLFALECEHDFLPPTWWTQTPSGGGHFWFKWPEAGGIGNRVRFRAGLDLRGDGGLVVVPPSMTEEREPFQRCARESECEPWSSHRGPLGRC